MQKVSPVPMGVAEALVQPVCQPVGIVRLGVERRPRWGDELVGRVSEANGTTASSATPNHPT